ncbi:serine/threonine-protein kinase H1 homolog [Tubulanus polymorphus]|uniref:serine/threonine-protein kinase H1 homolog n=1 Tax=Tubulanus polymorphus TaxID=672921 RepID=UPI003DA6468C
MGCINTKLVPELPSSFNQHQLVKTVAYQYQTGPVEDDYDDLKKKYHHRPNTTQRKTTQQSIKPQKQPKPFAKTMQAPKLAEGHEEAQIGPNKRVAKYRAKFDPRVTAKYEIKALIGRGSFSRVVRVEHKITRQPYAIKMIDRIQGRELYESEVSVLRRVRHEFIIQLVEVFDSKDKVYMVMELATGGELFDRVIAKGSFTERDATRVLHMVLEGIRYLHSLGITHRDLKPENLLYYHPGNDSKILITDFGLSCTRKNGDPFMTTTCGTPEYIAPEILARKPYTCLIDLWGIGVISFILMSGTMPFDDESRPRLYRLILKAKYSYSGEHWKDVSNLAKDFIDRLLVLDPNERLTADQCICHPWIVTHAAASSNKNLHKTISQNIMHRNSTRANSTKSVKSNKSARSLRSDNHRVQPEEIDELHRDPEVQADIESLHNYSLPSDRSVT